MFTNPLISIVMPTYNRANLIIESIRSVMTQSYTNWELIIVDDGSEDQTESVINAIASNKIKYLRIPHIGLLGKIRNIGIEKSTGRYIAFHDSDDLWRTDKLEFQLSLLAKHDRARFCFSNGDQFGSVATALANAPNMSSGKLFESMLFKNEFPLYMPSLIVDKEIFKSVNLLNENYRSGADLDFFFRLAFQYEGVFTNERLINIRKHRGSNSDKFSELSYTELMDMYDIFFTRQMITRSQLKGLRGNAFYKLGMLQYVNGREKNAFRNFIHYAMLNPMDWKGWGRAIQSSLKLIRP
jgi:glycosyltransferase involved in cell wall biosynthesis